MRKNQPNKIIKTIQIDIREDRNEDAIFLKLYDLINTGKKKETIQKSLVLLLKKGNEEVLEMLFGDNLEKAIVLAKKRVPRAKKSTTKRVLKRNTVERKPPIEEKIIDEKEENKEVIEEILPIGSAQEEEIIEPEVVMETPKTEVAKDDISSDEEIANILKGEDKGSSTTEESEGFFEELKLKRKKKEEEKTKLEEPTKEELEARKNKLIEKMEKRYKESEERKKENTVKWK